MAFPAAFSDGEYEGEPLPRFFTDCTQMQQDMYSKCINNLHEYDIHILYFHQEGCFATTSLGSSLNYQRLLENESDIFPVGNWTGRSKRGFIGQS